VPTADGGLHAVIADNPSDREQIERIRQHFQEEAAAFGRGDFGDPAQIHGAEMPGLAALQTGAERIKVEHGSRDCPSRRSAPHRRPDRRLGPTLESGSGVRSEHHRERPGHSLGIALIDSIL
jgi:hypothetical protein